VNENHVSLEEKRDGNSLAFFCSKRGYVKVRFI